ncbi:MAG: YraN family protein [Bacillota bacterium]
MSGYKKELGQAGEEAAVNFLTKNGYKILTRNFRCRSGEIDIIARDGDYLVFVEVKTRSGARFGLATEAVNYRKQQRLQKLAAYYILATGNNNVDCRFDVVTIQPDQNYNWNIEIIKNAF